jgi:modulator of FtsH protease HflC
MQARGIFFGIITIIGLMAFMNSVFVIDESERALKLRFGKVQRSSNDLPEVYEPGLHFKIPFADKVILLDARVQTMDGSPDVFTTSNKQFLNVDTYVQWRVKDFSQFYLRTNGQIIQAESLLERLVDNALRDQFGTRTLKESVSGQRSELMEQIRDSVNGRVPEYGLEVVDIRVKKANYTKQVEQQVFEQIKSERKAKATEIRSKGQQQGNIVMSKTDADVQRTLAEADEYARITRGKADGQVAKIYADTYNKNPEFYKFIRSLDAYKASFGNKDDVLVLKPDSDFFDYMRSSKGSKK